MRKTSILFIFFFAIAFCAVFVPSPSKAESAAAASVQSLPSPSQELVVLYQNGTYQENVAWGSIAWGQVDKVGIKRADLGRVGFEAVYGSVLWYPADYPRPIMFIAQRCWGRVGASTWHRFYIQSTVAKTPFYRAEADGWVIGWTANIPYASYIFPVSVAVKMSAAEDKMMFKTNITTPIALAEMGIEYRLYANPEYFNSLARHANFIRFYYQNGTTSDYKINGTTLDITYAIPDLVSNIGLMVNRTKLVEVSKFDFSDVFSIATSKQIRIESATLPDGQNTYVVSVGCTFGPKNAGETLVIDPATVGTSTSMSATAASWQPKVFYYLSRHWVWYFNGSHLICESDDEGADWSNSIETAVRAILSPIDFSIAFNGTHVAYAYAGNTRYLYYKMYTPQSDGTLLQVATEQTAVDSGAAADILSMTSISIDSNYAVWISYSWYDDSSYTDYFRITGTTKTDGTWTTRSGFPATHFSDGGVSSFQLLTLTSGKTYHIYSSGAGPIYGRLYTTSWSAQATITVGADLGSAQFAATAYNDNVDLVFRNQTGNNLLHYYYNGTLGTWAYKSVIATSAQVNPTSDPAVTLYEYSSAFTLRVFWCYGASTISYRDMTVRDTFTWGSVATFLTDTAFAGNISLNAAPHIYGSITGLMWLTGTGSPYNVRYNYTSANVAPTNDGCEASDLDSSNILAKRKYYSFSINCTDVDGVSDFTTIDLAFEQPANTYTNIVARWTQATDSFSVTTGSGYITLSGSTSGSSGNQEQLVFKVSFDWDYPLTSDIDAQVTSTDDASAADTDVYNLDMGFVSAVTTSPASDDYRQNKGGSVTISGTIVYAGTAISLPALQVTAVHVHDAAHASQGTDTNNGFSIAITLSSTVGSYAYHVYLNGAGDFVDVDIGNLPSEVVADSLTISISVADNRININENASVSVSAIYDHDSLPFDGTLALNYTTYIQSTAQRQGYTVQSASGGGYDITTIGTNDADYVIWDSLEVFNLQTVQYLGSGSLYYQAQIRYAYGSTVINVANTTLLNPSSSAILSSQSNSSGWVTYTITQALATASGNYVVYGVTDNNYGITAAGTNVTIALKSWQLVTQDNSGTTLSATTLTITNDSSTVYSAGQDTLRVPADTFNISVTWQSLNVNITSNLAISVDTVTNFSCTAYPYVKDGTAYHCASDATINSVSFSSNLITISFSSSVGTYTLKVSCPTSQPVYIVNATYDYDTAWVTSLVTLTHYSNTTIKISLANWGGNYIQSTDRLLTAAAWVDQTLSLTFTGTTSEVGQMEFYCGSRGIPQSTTGFTTTVYSASAKMFLGTYSFSSDKTVTMNWLTSGPGVQIRGGTDTMIQGNLMIWIDFSFGNHTMLPGDVVKGDCLVKWQGATVVYVYDVKFENGSLVSTDTYFPVKLTKSRELSFGESTFPITLNLSRSMPGGEYTLPCDIIFMTENAQNVTVKGNIKFTLQSLPSAAPEYMTVLFLGVFGVIFLGALVRRKRET